MSYMYAYTCLYITGSYSALSSGTLRARRCRSRVEICAARDPARGARAKIDDRARSQDKKKRKKKGKTNEKDEKIRKDAKFSHCLPVSLASPFARATERDARPSPKYSREVRVTECIRAGGNRLRHTIDAEGNKRTKKKKQAAAMRNVFHISR